MGKWIGLGVVLLLVLMLGMCGVGSYNGLVGSSQAVDAQWGQVENVYQRRADLIPNLVATVKGAAAFERKPGRPAKQVADAKDRKITQLEAVVAQKEAKLAQKNEVIAELMEDNVRSKKELGEL